MCFSKNIVEALQDTGYMEWQGWKREMWQYPKRYMENKKQ